MLDGKKRRRLTKEGLGVDEEVEGFESL